MENIRKRIIMNFINRNEQDFHGHIPSNEGLGLENWNELYFINLTCNISLIYLVLD